MKVTPGWLLTNLLSVRFSMEETLQQYAEDEKVQELFKVWSIVETGLITHILRSDEPEEIVKQLLVAAPDIPPSDMVLVLQGLGSIMDIIVSNTKDEELAEDFQKGKEILLKVIRTLNKMVVNSDGEETKEKRLSN